MIRERRRVFLTPVNMLEYTDVRKNIRIAANKGYAS
jgi:hypothetical protein